MKSALAKVGLKTTIEQKLRWGFILILENFECTTFKFKFTAEKEKSTISSMHSVQEESLFEILKREGFFAGTNYCACGPTKAME